MELLLLYNILTCLTHNAVLKIFETEGPTDRITYNCPKYDPVLQISRSTTAKSVEIFQMMLETFASTIIEVTICRRWIHFAEDLQVHLSMFDVLKSTEYHASPLWRKCD